MSKKKEAENTYIGRLHAILLAAALRIGEVGAEALHQQATAGVPRPVEQFHQVGDVRGGQPERLDLRELRVGGHVGDAVAEVGEGAVDRLRPPAFLLVRGAALHDADHAAAGRASGDGDVLRVLVVYCGHRLLLRHRVVGGSGGRS